MNKREEFEKALETYCDTIGGHSAPAVAAYARLLALFYAAQPSQDGLPELPKAHGLNQQRGDTIRYHGADMLAYGAQCRAAALEQAAQIVEREAMPSERPRFGVAADAIRALAAAPKGEV